MKTPDAASGRDPECVKRWPECNDGEYDPRCCRFPKSCSCTVYERPDPPAATEPAWTMPAWMEPYRESFENTGGNEIEWLLGDRAASNARANIILAALISCVESQVTLLHRMKRRGLLAGVDPDA